MSKREKIIAPKENKMRFQILDSRVIAPLQGVGVKASGKQNSRIIVRRGELGSLRLEMSKAQE